MKTIWTIGHSTLCLEEFIAMLASADVEHLADVRSYPGSRRFPHFNKEALAITMPQQGIRYTALGHLLGGRRKAHSNSRNTRWRHPSFRGYADHMDSIAFQMGVNALTDIASKQRTAFMCSEAMWWKCHRALLADHLRCVGWTVLHITGEGKISEHTYTEPARIINGQLRYY